MRNGKYSIPLSIGLIQAMMTLQMAVISFQYNILQSLSIRCDILD